MMAGVGLTDRMDLPRVVRAVAELDGEVVVAVERAQQAGLGGLPGNVRLIRESLALRLVLPTCAVLVHQGGAGTTMTALTYGVPQLIVPQVSDQHFNAERLAATGAGTWLAPGQTGLDQVRDQVADLVSGGKWRERAALMRERMRQSPTPAEVVPVLDALATGGHRAGPEHTILNSP
jgi:UDP:flavonoid glycosyltransferase YjiC (YdhE family)